MFSLIQTKLHQLVSKKTQGLKKFVVYATQFTVISSV
jgi:hypothetical protein